MVIRRALPSEAAVLTSLAMRSKAHWGYDAAFMERAAGEMVIAEELLEAGTAFVAQSDDGVLGFYVLCVENGAPTLRDLWIDPGAIGKVSAAGSGCTCSAKRDGWRTAPCGS